MNEMLPVPSKRPGALALSANGRAALTVLDEPLAEAATIFRVARDAYDQKFAIAPIVDLASAIVARRQLWPRVDEVSTAARMLWHMTLRDPGGHWGAVTEQEVARMFALVHGALRKRAGDPESEAFWLHSIVRMFTGDGDPLASFTNKLPRHRTVVALAVQRILDTATFLPVPSEVRAVVMEVYARVCKLHGYTRAWLGLAKHAEMIVFRQDRARWELVYVTRDALDTLAALIDDDADPDLNAAYNALDDAVAAKEANDDQGGQG
jgi:hypothetical protein